MLLPPLPRPPLPAVSPLPREPTAESTRPAAGRNRGVRLVTAASGLGPPQRDTSAVTAAAATSASHTTAVSAAAVTAAAAAASATATAATYAAAPAPISASA